MLTPQELTSVYLPHVKNYEILYDGTYEECIHVHQTFKSIIKKCLFKFHNEVTNDYSMRFTQIQALGSVERKSYLQIQTKDNLYVINGLGKTGNGAFSFFEDFNRCLSVPSGVAPTAQTKITKPKAVDLEPEFVTLLRKDMEESAKFDKSLTPDAINFLISNIQW